MSLAAERTALSVLIHYLVYCDARCKANPMTTEVAAQLKEPLAGLLLAMGDRNKAANQTIVTSAARDYTAEVVTDLFVPIGQLLASTQGGSRSTAAYLRVFPRAPSDFAATPQKDQLDAFQKFLVALQDHETPKALAAATKEFAAALTALQVAVAADVKAEEALTKAIQAIGKARTVALDALAAAEADLRKIFLRKRKKVAVFFPRSVKKVSKVAVIGGGASVTPIHEAAVGVG